MTRYERPMPEPSWTTRTAWLPWIGNRRRMAFRNRRPTRTSPISRSEMHRPGTPGRSQVLPLSTNLSRALQERVSHNRKPIRSEPRLRTLLDEFRLHLCKGCHDAKEVLESDHALPSPSELYGFLLGYQWLPLIFFNTYVS